MATDNVDSNNLFTSGSGDLAGLLERSPWGRLSEVTSTENVLEGFRNATGGSGGSAPIAGGGIGGGNPFTNFGNPNASNSPLTGNENPWTAINNVNGSNNAPTGGSTGSFSGSDISGGVSAGGFSGGDISGSASTGGFGGGNISGGGNAGGIDFGSANQSLSFQYRVEIDNLINEGPTDESVQGLSSRITDSVVNQVSLGSTSSVNSSGVNQFAGENNQFAGGSDNQFASGGNPFA